MGEAFFGYLLPWGQMSFWGAQVIVNLFGAIPVIGNDLSILIRGDFVVGDATLNRFFSFHVIAFPLVLLGLVAAHILALHETGSNNPDGIDIKENKDENGIPRDGIPFHPYYSVKDIVGVVVFLMIFSAVMFWAPEGAGLFLETPNFYPADPLKTPPHIAPVWYFTPYYSILRAVVWNFFGLDAKFWGVVAMGASVVIFAFLPWLDRSPVRSIRYRGPITKVMITIFVICFFILGYLGTQSPSPMGELVSQICTVFYFGFFLAMPWWSRMDKFKPVPERVTMK
jgi:ubiquinol-cytochrome c reductase cytochrome b subunit